MSLLIALAAERYLSSPIWQFNNFYHHYLRLVTNTKLIKSPWESNLVAAAFIFLPVLVVYFLMQLIDDGLLNFIISTFILILSFGCVKARDTYKNFLLAAFRGEATTCEMHHLQLQQDTAQPNMSFGQLLVWLNYRYFIAIMIFFVLFGAAGAIFYRLLVTFAEGRTNEDIEVNTTTNEQVKQWLFWADWIPVRLVAFGYMLVGHFSKALPVWLESIFDLSKAPYKVLSDVAEKAEDFMIDGADCTAEPCLLVRLAKRTLLLCLAVIAVLILTGIVR